jgi:hypothetical protein
MADKAKQVGSITLVPFTYHYMPVNRWVRQLVAEVMSDTHHQPAPLHGLRLRPHLRGGSMSTPVLA